jgi:hypothetical protein
VDWDQQQPQHGGPNSSSSSSSAAAMSGTGRGIGSKGAAVIDHDAIVATLRKKGGWSAPFPEEIPIFPIRKSTSSGRLEEEMPPLHSSPAAASPKKNDDKDDDGDAKMASADNDDADDDPDASIEQRELKMWGVLLDATTTAPAATATVASSTDNKDIKTDPKDASASINKKRSHAQITNDPFMPQFYPPLPSSTKSAKKIAKVVTTSDQHPVMAATMSRSTARSRSQDEDNDNEDDDTAAAATTTTTDQTALLSVRAALVVRSGRPAKPPEPKVVVPVSRHSSAPVSRILEGSMDPSQP